MTDTNAPKIDTQAPRIGITTGIDFSTGKDTTMLTLMIDGKLDHASTNGPWGQAIMALLAERDLADARAAAAAQAMREAAVKAAHEWWLTTPCERPDMLVSAIPLPDTAALDRLIAERVREAVEAEREACAKVADEHVARYQALLDKAKLSEYMTHYGRLVDAVDGVAEDIRAALGSKEGRDG